MTATVPKGFYDEALFGSDGRPFVSAAAGSLRLVQTGTGFPGTPMVTYADVLGTGPDPTGAARTDPRGNLRAYLDPDAGHFDIYTGAGLLFTSDLGVPVTYNPSTVSAATVTALQRNTASNIRQVSAAANVAPGDFVEAAVGATAFPLTLVGAAGAPGRTYIQYVSGTAALTVQVGTTVLFTLATVGQEQDVQWDGTTWSLV